MAFSDFSAAFAPVLPALRAAGEITADLNLSASGRATDIARSSIAEIETHIHAGDALYNRKQFARALEEFRQARALIYKKLYPGFHVGSYLGKKDVALPVSKALETAFINAGIRYTDVVRPTAPESAPAVVRATEPAPAALASYMQTGFRESQSIEENLQVASALGVALLEDNKAEAAIGVMSDALAAATVAGASADPALLAAVQLNLASAYVQSADAPRAAAMAGAALERFKAVKDTVGQAQALHVSGVAAQQANDPAKARQFFTQAAETLKGASAPRPPAPAPAPGVTAPGPVPAAPFATTLLSGAAAAPALAARPAITNLIRANITERAVTMPIAQLGSRDVAVLQPIANMDARTLTFRIPGRADGWGVLPVTDELQKRQQSKTWTVGVPAGGGTATFTVGAGAAPAATEVVAKIYQARVTADQISKLAWQIVDTSTVSFYLTHLYAYVLPVKIADCYHQMGQYAKAEEYYIQASAYTYLNQKIEATALWIRMGRNALEWADSLYRAEDAAGAKTQYSKLVNENGTVPNSFLYTTASLQTPANAARTLIQNLLNRPLPAIEWDIAMLVLSAYERLQQIAEGLDFYGLLFSPIHTFEYLQSVARGFAQEAIQAEREFVNFKTRQESEEATRRDLETAKAMAEAEAEGRRQQYLAAQEDETGAQRAVQLATQRRDDAVAQRNQYASASAAQIWAQAASQAQGMGQDSWYGEIAELADKLDRGESISGPRGKLAAAYTLQAGRRTRDYELKKMQDNINELNAAIGIAASQLAASRRRTAAAEIAWQAALQRAAMAAASLNAFDAEFFTPEAWSKMADVMRDIARSYLWRGIRIAKLMERAYNFENDTQLKVIKNDYGHAVANPAAGQSVTLLGGDSLLQDIEGFTYTAITTKTRKNSRIKDVISVAASYPAQFEEFRQTGLLSIETDLYEFDRLHPGFYSQRIEAVELEIIGLLPESGLNGTLAAGGVTAFRKRDNSSGKRVHQVDTMALSSFLVRNDVFLYSTDTGVRGLFQGIGLGSTWQLHLPKRSNDFDYRRIFDVNLILYYTAQFDLGLRQAVLAAPPRPDEMARLKNFALRYDFPDAWYAFYQSGAASFVIDAVKLPANQTNFKTKAVNVRVMCRPGVANSNIGVRITGPNAFTGTATTDATGTVSSGDPALAGLNGGSPIGAWRVEITGGASLLDGAALKLDRVYNVQFGLEYSFDFPPEVI